MEIKYTKHFQIPHEVTSVYVLEEGHEVPVVGQEVSIEGKSVEVIDIVDYTPAGSDITTEVGILVETFNHD